MIDLSQILVVQGVDLHNAAQCQQTLVGRYQANQLSYHNLQHIKQTLRTAAQLIPTNDNHSIVDSHAILTALWFHDVIYNPKAADNEERSADYARTQLNKIAVADSWIDHVCELILDTKTHIPKTAAGQIVVDADLSILGSSPEKYDQYAQAIAQEYNWVPENDYRRGRSQVLERFLNRSYIYHTQAGREQWEAQARINLQKERIELENS